MLRETTSCPFPIPHLAVADVAAVWGVVKGFSYGGWSLYMRETPRGERQDGAPRDDQLHHPRDTSPAGLAITGTSRESKRGARRLYKYSRVMGILWLASIPTKWFNCVIPERGGHWTPPPDKVALAECRPRKPSGCHPAPLQRRVERQLHTSPQWSCRNSTRRIQSSMHCCRMARRVPGIGAAVVQV